MYKYHRLLEREVPDAHAAATTRPTYRWTHVPVAQATYHWKRGRFR